MARTSARGRKGKKGGDASVVSSFDEDSDSKGGAELTHVVNENERQTEEVEQNTLLQMNREDGRQS